MKKLISLVLILCMACMLIPAVAEEDVTGTWYLVEVVTQGMTINPADMGMKSMVTLNADGTLKATMEMMGESQEQDGTWAQDGDTLTINQNDSTNAMTIIDGKLVISDGEQSMIYGREEAVASPKAATVAAESEEAFLGTWSIVALDIMGVHATKDQFASFGLDDYDVTLVIEPGKVILKSSYSGSESTSEMESVFADGKLTVTIPDLAESLKAAAEAGLEISMSDTQSIELVEDGTILYGMDFMGMAMSVYLEKTEAAAEEPAA